MAGVVVYLYGGQCDGTQKTLTQRQFDSGKTTCKGQTYKIDKTDFTSFELPVFKWVGAASPNAPVSQTLKAPQALKGWKDMQKSINHKLPSALQASQKSRRAALRSLHRIRRVKI